MSDQLEFAGKVAIITGAAIGIGFEIARSLVVRGASIVLNDLDESAGQEAVRQMNEKGTKAVFVAGDAGQLGTIQRLVKAAREHFGHLDIIFANAGITTFGPFLEYSEKQFQNLIDLNLKGTFFLAQQGARELINQDRPGRILLMSSVTGHTYHRDLNAYGMTKAAIVFLAKSLGVELAPYGITVNAISPGATLTERTEVLDDGAYEKVWNRTTPNGRCATTADIASAALFLLSDGASHITGQTLVVDGGWTSISPEAK